MQWRRTALHIPVESVYTHYVGNLKTEPLTPKRPHKALHTSLGASPRPKISIIVPTRNREASLRRFLIGLERLANPRQVRLEVLIVDNNSQDGTAIVLREAETKQPIVKGLFESQRGQSAAINCGLKQCNGEVICLLDDDVVLDVNWIDNLLSSYESTDFDAIQGRVLPGVDPSGNKAAPEMLHYYNIPVVDYGDHFIAIRGLTGAHMTLKKDVLEKVGYFDTRLGPGAAGFSGDTEFSARVRRAGFKIGYTPYAVAYHELNPDRYGRAYNRDVEYRKGISRSIYRSDSLLLRVIPNLIANCLRFMLYRLVGNSRKAYKTEGRVFKSLGYLAGKLRADRTQPRMEP